MSRILGNSALPGDRRLLRVQLPDGAPVGPGQWFRLSLEGGPAFALPVLDQSRSEGWLAFSAPPEAGDYGRSAACALDGPHGTTINPTVGGRRLVLLADETGLPAAVFAAMHLNIHLVLAGLESDTPAFRLRPSRFLVTSMSPGAIAGVGALEDAGVASRIAHPEPLPGCREGALPALLDDWLAGQSARERWDTAVAVVATDATIDALHQRLRGSVGEVHAHPLPAVE